MKLAFFFGTVLNLTTQLAVFTRLGGKYTFLFLD